MNKRIKTAGLCMLVLSAMMFAGCKADETKVTATDSGAQMEKGTSKLTEDSAQEKVDIQAAVVLKLATEMAEGTPETDAAYQFAEKVLEKTNGAVKIEIYASGQLGEPATVIESAQLGNVDIIVLPASDFKAFNKVFGVEAIPFLYANNEILTDVLFESGIADTQKQILADNDMILLNEARNYFRGPYRVMVSKKPVNNIDDLKGLRFRTFENKNYMTAYETLKANPIVIPWSETFTALQNGLAEAATCAIMNLRDEGLTEVAPYVSNVNEYVSTVMVIAGRSSFENLSEENRIILKECADGLGTDVDKIAGERLDADIEAMEAAGAVFTDIDTSPMRAALKEFYYSLEKDGTLPEGTVDVALSHK